MEADQGVDAALRGALALVAHDGWTLLAVADDSLKVLHSSSSPTRSTSWILDDGVWRRSLETNRPIAVVTPYWDQPSDKQITSLDRRYRSVVYIPIVGPYRYALGMLAVYRRAPRRFSRPDAAYLQAIAVSLWHYLWRWSIRVPDSLRHPAPSRFASYVKLARTSGRFADGGPRAIAGPIPR